MPEPANLKEQINVLARIPRHNQGSRLTRANDGRWWATLGNNGRLWVRDIETREALLYDVYEIINGLWAFHVDPMPGKDWAEATKQPGQIRMQHARKWIKTLAATYKSEVSRKLRFKGEDLPDDAPEVLALNKAYTAMRINEAMQKLDFNMLAYGCAVARVHWDVDTSTPVLHRYPAYRVRPVENAANPAHPWALLLMGQRAERDSQMRANLVDVGEAWTREEFAEIKGGTVGAYHPIETARPPLVIFSDELQDNETGFFVEALGVALARLNVVLNEDLWTPFGSTLLMQGFGQWIGYNLGPKSSVQMGPDRMMAVDSSPDNPARVENIQPNAPLNDIREAIDRIVQEIRYVYDIPESEFNVVTDAASGAAIVQAKAPTMERREERIKLFREPENNLARATLDVLSTFDDLTLRGDLNDYEVSVNLKRESVSVAVLDQIAQEEHDLKWGLIDTADLLMRRDPVRYPTREAAEAEMAKREARKAKARAAAPKQEPEMEPAPDEGDEENEEGLDTSTPRG